MECNEFQKNMQDFLDNRLGMLKKEEFIKHIKSCSECNDDLETYYIIVTCVKELDSEFATSNNYHSKYKEFIKNTIEEIKNYKLKRRRHRIAFPGIVGITVLLTGVSIKKEEGAVKIKEVAEDRKFADFTDNDLSMRFRFSESRVLSEPSFNIAELLEKVESGQNNEK